MRAPDPLLSIGWDAFLVAARTAPETQITTWDDVQRIDVRPSRGIAKIRGKSRWEVQVDTSTGEVLHVAYRRSDLIESLHDGSFFGDATKLAIFLPTGIVLFGLWLTGIWLWLAPHVAKRRRMIAHGAFIVTLCISSRVHAQAESDEGELEAPEQSVRGAAELPGPNATENQLREDLEPKPNFFDVNILAPYEDFKTDLYEATGLRFGGDYSALYFRATDSPGDRDAASGMLRLYGSWDLIGRDADNTGALVYKVEHRHRYTDVPPSAFASELGYVGILNAPFSDQGWRLTNLFWRQRFFDQRLSVVVGFLDVTDFVDAYALASPWTGFGNLVFSTGSATIALPNDATLGAAAGGYLTDHLYAIASLTDANADPTDPFEGFNTLFNDFETFKSLEIGWTSGRDRLLLDNVHVTFWHVDQRDAAGTPDGWGINFSASAWIDEQWLPFVRAGWADDGGSLLEASVSVGFGYQRERGGDVIGVGLNWGRPNRDTFGPGLDDQYTGEIFYRWQLAQNVQLTPSVQLLVDSALNPDQDVIGVFGLRARVSF
jgi:porin